MRTLRLLTAAIALTASLAVAQNGKSNFNVPGSASRVGASPMEVRSDACFHTILENEQVKMFQIQVGPHNSTGLDIHHHDYVVLSLGRSNMEIAGPGNTFPLPMEDGDMQVLTAGWPHQINNLGNTQMKLVEIEVTRNIHPERALCGLASPECTDGHFGASDGASYTQSTLFETDTVKLRRTFLGAGATLPDQSFRPRLLIALSDIRLGDGTYDLQLKAGEGTWYSAKVSHPLKNLDKDDARMITLEVK